MPTGCDTNHRGVMLGLPRGAPAAVAEAPPEVDRSPPCREIRARSQPGNLFENEGEDVSLEPGQQVETEITFPVREDKLGLMAVRVLIQGQQGSRRNTPYWWGTFFFANPDWIEKQERTSLALAAKGEA